MILFISTSRQGDIPPSKGRQLVSIVPPDLKSAELTAKWEQKLKLIEKGQISDAAFISEMREYASRLVKEVTASDAKFTHDNVTREKCPECGKYLLDVNGKKGRMLVCPDRECGYRKGVSVITNARCPNCHKKLEMRGEGENKTSSARADTVKSLRTSKSGAKRRAPASVTLRNISVSRKSRAARATPRLQTSSRNGLKADLLK